MRESSCCDDRGELIRAGCPRPAHDLIAILCLAISLMIPSTLDEYSRAFGISSSVFPISPIPRIIRPRVASSQFRRPWGEPWLTLLRPGFAHEMIEVIRRLGDCIMMSSHGAINSLSSLTLDLLEPVHLIASQCPQSLPPSWIELTNLNSTNSKYVILVIL